MAEQRAQPRPIEGESDSARYATVPGTEKGDRLGVLRLDFRGDGGGDLAEVSWDE